MNFKEVLIRLVAYTTPFVYDNNISLLELVRKLYKIVNELCKALQDLNANYEKFKEETNKNLDDLKQYVDDYFNNLDLSAEVKSVIDSLITDGTLANLINQELLGNINNHLSEIDTELETIKANIETNTSDIANLKAYDEANTINILKLNTKQSVQIATCEANSNYVITNDNLDLRVNDVIYTHFNQAIDNTKNATLTINNVAKNVINKDGSLFLGKDLENTDLILKVGEAGVYQIVDIADLQNQINAINTNFNKNVLDLIYPIGSIIYNDDENFNPNTIFGGTWEKIKGKMIIGLDDTDSDFNTLKASGGNKTHTQTLDELAEHKHEFAKDGTVGGNGQGFAWASATTTNNSGIVSAGKSKPMNIMNPYYVANIWHRVA